MDGAGMDEIGAFLAVAEARSFTAASRALGRDASIVSRRVSALELRLGVRLLERSTRHVALTEAGARLDARMRDATAAMADAEAEATRTGGTVQGVLRLAVPAAFGRLWVAPLLPSFLARYPQVSIEAEYADRYVDLIAEGFDVAIRIGELQDSRLVARTLAPNRRVICAAPAYLAARGQPQTPGDLARHACLGFSRLDGHPEWRFTRADRVATVRISGPLTTDDAQSLVTAALAGSGIMMSSDWLASPELAQGRLVPLLTDWTVGGGGGVHLVRPSARFTSGKTAAFMAWMADGLNPPPGQRDPAGEALTAGTPAQTPKLGPGAAVL